MANRRIEIDIVANVRALNRALSGSAPAVRQAATNFQRVYERAFAGINRAEEQRRRASEQAASQTARAHGQAARQQQRVYEQAFAAIQRAEQRRARESQRIAEQLARQQQQSARDAQRQQSGGPSFGSLVGAGTLSGLAVSGITAAFGAFTDAVQRAAQAYRDFMAEGIRFNAQLETTKLAIQSLIAGNLITSGSVKDVGAAFRIAGPQAEDQLRKLRIEALASTATFEGLAAAFQQAIGPGLAKGLSLDQIRTLTLQIGQAGKSIGQSDFELPQEVRALLEGKIDRNARIANMLQITSADIAKFKGNADGLFNYLNEKTKSYRFAGELAAQTFAGLLSNVKETFTFFAAESSIKTFSSLKNILGDIQKQFLVIKKDSKGAITDVQIAPAYKEIASVLDRIGSLLVSIAGGALKQIMDGAQSVGRFLGENREQVDRIFKIIQGIGSDLLANIKTFLAGIAGSGNEWLSITESLSKEFRVILDLVGKYIVKETLFLLGLLKSLLSYMRTAIEGAHLAFARVSDVVMTINGGIGGINAGLDGLISKTQAWAASLLDPLGVIRAISSATGFGGIGSLPGGASGDATGVELMKLQQEMALVDTSFQALGMFARNKTNPPPGGGGKGGGGGSQTDPAAEAIAQRRADMQRNFDFQKTLLESAQKIAKQKIDEETEANEAAWEDRLISFEAYLAKKSGLSRRASALEIASIEQEKAFEKQRYEEAIKSYEQAASITDDKKRTAATKKAKDDLAESTNKLFRLEADLSVARSKSAQTGAQNEREITRAVREQQQAYEDLETQIKELEGKRFEAARDRINAEADAAIDRIRSKVTIGQDGAPESQPLTEAEQREIDAINRKRDLNLANLNIQEKAAAIQATIAQISADQAEIQLILQQNGGVQLEQDRARLQVLRDRIALLQSQRADLATAIQGNPTAENQQILTDVDGQIRGLGNTSMTIAGQIRQNLYGAFTNLFQGLMSGTQSAGQAFAAFAQQVIGSIQQMIAQMIAMWIVQKLIGIAGAAFGAVSSSGSLGNAGLGAGSSGGFSGTVVVGHGVPGRAKGGPVQAGRAYIVGENQPELFVPRQSGTILPNLNVPRLNSPAAPMGEDGVGMGGGGGRQRIELNNVIVDRRESVSEHLQSAAGQRDIVSVIQRNGRTIRAALGIA